MLQFFLRKLALCSCVAATVSLSAKIKVGDSYAQVLQEKGLPTSKIEAGQVHLLHYPDRTIKLEHGIVTSVQTATAPTKTVHSATASASTAKKAAPRASEESTSSWETDFAAALIQAKAENRQVFLFFTGSDWCGWCIRLHKEILSTAEFTRYAKEKLILVEIDFPRQNTQSTALKAQNAKLAKRYNIEGYPTVIVLDSSGKKIDELGYQEGGPTPFVSRLSKL